MILCLDVGNTHLYGGVYDGDTLVFRFRYNSQQGGTSDQIGVFLKSVIHENALNANMIKQISMCSVLPSIDYSIQSACIKYLNITPFILRAGVRTGLKIKYRNPLEVGADRIANAIAAVERYPKQPIIIVDFGTATTVCAISVEKEYLGGVILPGIKLSMDALQMNAAKLMPVEIIKPQVILGRSTIESIQSGLYYGQIATIKDLIKRITMKHFTDVPPIVISTGGFSNLFESDSFYMEIQPDLVLEGLVLAFKMNQ